MGFMGFGMKKEVYKRNPKEPFKKLKELYGNDPLKIKHKKDAPKLTTKDVLNRPRFNIQDIHLVGNSTNPFCYQAYNY